MHYRVIRALACLACLLLIACAVPVIGQEPAERLGEEKTYWITNEKIYAPARPILTGPYVGYVRKSSPPIAQTAQASAQPLIQPITQPAATDPYGFTNWLNSVRSQYGLRTVSYDQHLTNWAAVNNQHQAARGMGHHAMGPARRQNSAMGNYAVIGAMWMASPAHQSALLDPTITYIGIAGAGAYWTFNAY